MRLYKATPITFLSSRKSRHLVCYRINVLKLPITSNFRAKVQIFSVDGYMWRLSAAWHDPVSNITSLNTMHSMLQPADSINSVVWCLCPEIYNEGSNLQVTMCCYLLLSHNLSMPTHIIQNPCTSNTYYSKPLHVENLKRHEDLVAKNRLQLWGLEQVDIEAPKYS